MAVNAEQGSGCPLCGGEALLRYRQFASPWWRCVACGLVFRSPEKSRSYESGCCFGQAEFRYGRSYAGHYRRALEEFLPLLARGRWVELGFGHGGYLQAAAELGCDVLGIDTSPLNCQEVTRRFGVPAFCGTLEEARLPPASVDTFLLSHVIEHFPNPITTLGEIRQALKPGGRVVIITSNVRCYLERLLGHRWTAYREEDHVWLFGLGTLRQTLQAAGLVPLRVWTTEALYDFPFGVASALRVAAGAPSTGELAAENPDQPLRLRRLAFKTLPLVGLPFLLMPRWGLGSCLKAVAEKPLEV